MLLNRASGRWSRMVVYTPHAQRRYASTFSKILVANRGEIACRVMRTAQKTGVQTVAVYSEADRNSMHVHMASEAHLIGAPPARESYLRGDTILKVAKQTGAQAIHPGYGFLSENAEFAELCEKEGVTFIGPPASAIRAMGSKSASKDIMIAANVPCVPGYHGEAQDMDTLQREAKKIGYPVLIKAVLGGGGKGMRIVEKEEDLEEGVASSQREAISSFGDSRVLIEKYLRRPRHVEIQVFADKHQNAVYLFERDCSVQRRHQKVIEEAPAPLLSEEVRAHMGKAAVQAAKAVGYVGAGTVEFIMDQDGTFYFMEMNTRLQVEHPITEMITGQDLVDWQLRVASGQKLPLRQDQLKINGHAFEARIYAENPESNFLPGTGKLVHLSAPEPSEHIRIETGVRQGDEVSVYYDPMIAKLVVWDEDRMMALKRLRLALDQYNVVGLHTNLNFLRQLARHKAFEEGKVETGFIPQYQADLIPPRSAASPDVVALATLGKLLGELTNTAIGRDGDVYSPWNQSNNFRVNTNATRTLKWLDDGKEVVVKATYNPDGSYTMDINGKDKIKVTGRSNNDGTFSAQVGGKYMNSVRCTEHKDNIDVFYQGQSTQLTKPAEVVKKGADTTGSLLSPMPGKIVKVFVKPGDAVKKGAPLVIMEAMKMEHTIRSPADGVVESVRYALNELVEEKKVLVTVK